MHRSILGVGLGAWTLAGPAAVCPDRGPQVVERFVSADCPDCWSAADQARVTGGWLFDWITPTAALAEAPLSAAASPEARERALRLGGPSPVAQQVVIHRASLPAPTLALVVKSGPAWNGYFGLQFTARGRVPRGATGWLALVEEIPAGSEGSAVARELVRSVAGPLALAAMRPTRAVDHLVALRWPETAQPDRLRARAWVESTDGRLLAVASEGCAVPARP